MKNVDGLAIAENSYGKLAGYTAHRLFLCSKDKQMTEYDETVNFMSLLKAGKLCMKKNRWKASVQAFEMDILYYIARLCLQLENGTYAPRSTFDFDLLERGKWRRIRAHHITDRSLYKSMTIHSLEPETSRIILPNNSASQRGKGTDHAINLFRQGLVRAYKRWGRDFYVVTADYHDYFGSIPHDLIPIAVPLSDPGCVDLLTQYVEVFPGDFGIGIGGEPSQVIAIVYPSSVDRDILCNCPTLTAGRYMDDSWAICHTIDEARYTRDRLIERSEELGLQINMNRTNIHHMDGDSVTWLKKRTHLDPDTGKIVMQLTRENVRDRKRAIKFQIEMVESGQCPRISAFQSIQCWCGYALKYNSYQQVKIVVREFSEAFGVPDDVARHLLHKKTKGWLQLCEDRHLL